MRCSKCDSDNREGRKFCATCGAPLVVTCPKCGATNQPDERFCGDCGVALWTKNTATQSRGSPWSSRDTAIIAERTGASPIGDGERKTVTALFADIKGSMELMEDLDPEEAREIVDPALKLMIDAVQRYGGYVVQSTGDGIFALFGAPIAYEDHPQRALYASIRLQEATRAYSAQLVAEGGTPLEARVGINTGEVVVRTLTTADGHGEYTPIGHTTNLAARMQAVAPTGSIAITEQTRSLVEGYFQLKARGPTRLKGLSEPINVYEVVGLGPLRTRLQRAVGRGLTRFVGREREMEVLKRALAKAATGHGQLVAAMAEPGVGKSRLFYEFKAVSHFGCMGLEAYSISHGKASAYLPVIELLQSYFKIAGDDDPRTRREKITGRVLALDRGLEDTLPYLFALLGLTDEKDALVGMDAEIRKRRTLEAIKRMMLRESLNQPLIVIFEDLHWIDQHTQELLNLLAESIGTAKILLLVNYRPEYSHTWSNKTYYEQLRLDPLPRESAEEMLTALLGEGAELAALKRLIIEKTEGTPFFMEELVQALFEQQVLVRNGAVHLTRPLGELKIPPTVQAMLASRIDRLPSEQKDLLQCLAVIGREFSVSLVRKVTRRRDERLHRILDDLQLAEFIYEQPAAGELEYTFKHALTQEVAYSSLLMERRRALHEATAQAIEGLFAERLEDHLSELAHHYRHSSNLQKAIYYLQRAGEQAVQRSIYTEAVTYFTAALEVLKNLPNGPERIEQELVLQIALGPALYIVMGAGHIQVATCYERARDLCTKLGNTPYLFPVLRGLWMLNLVRGHNRTAGQLAEQLVSLAEQQPDNARLRQAHYTMGLTTWSLGQLTDSQAHFEQSILLYDHAKHASEDSLYGYSTQAASLVDLALVLWWRGYADQAVERVEEALALARVLSHPASLAMVYDWMAYVHMFRRGEEYAQKYAEAAIGLSSEQGIPNWLVIANFIRGWALAQGNDQQAGIAQMRDALAMAGEIWQKAFLPGHLCLLAEAHQRAGNPIEARTLLAEAFAFVEQTGDVICLAELYRVKGRLCLASDLAVPESGRELEAESCFRQAIDVARSQDAKSLELRATRDLAGLFAKQGKCEEASRMLAEIYNRFTEGFETADLKEAKALLEQLAK